MCLPCRTVRDFHLDTTVRLVVLPIVAFDGGALVVHALEVELAESELAVAGLFALLEIACGFDGKIFANRRSFRWSSLCSVG